MVAIQAILKSNACIAELPPSLVALFLGATSGIGRSALIQFARHAVRPRIYIVARPASKIKALLDELHDINREGTYTVIQKDVSLIRETSEVVEFFKARETKLDLLFQSVGFISLNGRQDTVEGLDPSMTTRCYSRLRAVQGLLPLLNEAATPRVVSILAGGQEGKMMEEDLDLRRPGNYSIVAAAVHSATMLTLAFEHLARENPGISFVHAFPGAVATPLLSRGSTGLVRLLMTGIVHPLVKAFATSADDAGARALFYLTSDLYSIKKSTVTLTDGIDKPPMSGGGIFLVNEKSESVDNEKVLADYRAREVDKQVWRHVTEIFNACAERVS
ncbi:NAD(P)-binding protein [Thozetella sp. PMI_491]|nr:NAD(P)-binding protein [Thozetella sp. PMI_491]